MKLKVDGLIVVTFSRPNVMYFIYAVNVYTVFMTASNRMHIRCHAHVTNCRITPGASSKQLQNTS